MKKTLLLLLSVGTFTALFAQDGRYRDDRDKARDIVLGNDNRVVVYNNATHNVPGIDNRKRDEEIARASRDYDHRIDAVQHDRHLRSRDKDRQISQLQRDKVQAIREINQRYEKQRLYRH